MHPGLLWPPFWHKVLCCPQGSQTFSEPRGQFPHPSSLLTKNFLCPGGQDNDSCPGCCNSNLSTRVAICRQLLTETLVQFSFRDATSNTFPLLGNLPCHLAAAHHQKENLFNSWFSSLLSLSFMKRWAGWASLDFWRRFWRAGEGFLYHQR